MSLDLKQVQQTAEAIARKAAEKLLEYFETPLEQMSKISVGDIVTQADKASEAVIVEALQSAYPDHHIVGEEGGGMGASAENAEYFWYVDPLDGTVNFANKIPVFSISLALTDRNREPVAGVVYAPVWDEMYSGAVGHGATLNGKPLQVSAATELIHCVVASGFPYTKYTDPDNNLRQWGDFLVRTRGMRRMGSAAIDMCFVAVGRFDGYWEKSLHPWDYLAGVIFVREAGGIVSDYTGSQASEFYQHGRIVASNGKIHGQMLDVLALSTAAK